MKETTQNGDTYLIPVIRDKNKLVDSLLQQLNSKRLCGDIPTLHFMSIALVEYSADDMRLLIEVKMDGEAKNTLADVIESNLQWFISLIGCLQTKGKALTDSSSIANEIRGNSIGAGA